MKIRVGDRLTKYQGLKRQIDQTLILNSKLQTCLFLLCVMHHSMCTQTFRKYGVNMNLTNSRLYSCDLIEGWRVKHAPNDNRYIFNYDRQVSYVCSFGNTVVHLSPFPAQACPHLRAVVISAIRIFAAS